MAKKRAKKNKNPSRLKELRLKAKQIYLSNNGEYSLGRLATELGVVRQTIYKWKAEDNWEQTVEDIKVRTNMKLTESIGDALAKKIEPQFMTIASAMDAAGKLAVRQLFKHDKEGRMLRDVNGNPMPNEKLSPNEIKTLMTTFTEWQKGVSLFVGKSTSNVAVAGQVNTGGAVPLVDPSRMLNGPTKEDREYKEVLASILEGGAPKEQETLMEIFQGIAKSCEEGEKS